MADTPSRTGRMPRPVIFVCDIQEKFRNAIHQFDKVVLTATKVLKAAHILQIPIFTTTQNRARLGDTVAELAPYISGPLAQAPADKTRFSMWIPAVSESLTAAGGVAGGAQQLQIVIVGIEAHICVTQTALDALAAGHRVYVLADGVSSCNAAEVGVALARLRAEGAVVTTSESWLYECMGDATVPEFKSIVGLVKETSADTKAALQNLVPAKM
ncbi:Isochorismatase domain-containing protein [Pleurostoma richardsiae]|uniref:Isochorismatase domain-containing protein n=1 Tax=Pleurostoma richardsiae TaxID=41990 RepID=A0AA38VWM5_9PEZI|nr:Isochorismatase domain-containing protein [Pleurostoma richardsiae]